MSTVEAVQCQLGESFILWPGTPENPPKIIRDEDIYYAEPRRFDKPNPDGPVFIYHYNYAGKCWYLEPLA